ncbi:MAG: flagellar basal body rod protein FlgC [Clostridia bacterium]|nr:flagellar basal body rod protein FlgC [Clostridia bacterium]
MRLFSSMDTSSSGLIASRIRMDVISSNIANANTTRTAEGGPYRRKTVSFREQSAELGKRIFNSTITGSKMPAGKGVVVDKILNDQSPFKLIYDPAHPDANQEGYVQMPNVNIVTEMVDMISATRAYEANVTAINTAKNMAVKALEIGRG